MADVVAMNPMQASFPVVARPDAAAHPDRPVERGAAEYFSRHGTFAAGFWEAGPGEFQITGYPVDELCVLLEGRIDVHGDGQPPRTFMAGEAFVIARGFTGRWVLPAKARKLFACAGPAPLVTAITGDAS